METQEFQPSNLQNSSFSNNQFESRPSKKFPAKIISIISVIIILLLIGGGAYYAYVMKLGPFAISPYTEKNLVSGMLSAISRIDSSSYAVSASVAMAKRDADAEPFTTKLSNAAEIKKQYQNDSKRAQDISGLLSKLYYYKNGVYPISLQSLINDKKNYYYTSLSSTDPATKNSYGYEVTENGKNFNLTVTFQTNDAISKIKRSYNFSPTATIINGKTITFTKGSNSYFYLSSEPPKPFLVSLAEAVTYFPTELNASLSASAQTDLSNKESADWKFNVDATGDFGDLTYKFNVDALKKASIYYFRINNMPSFFFSYIGLEKNQWVSIDPSKATSNSSSYGQYSSSADALSEAEKNYKEHREEIANLLKKIVKIADEKNLLKLKNPAYAEKVNGRDLYRYDLLINKDAILPFYESVSEEFNKTDMKNSYPVIEDSAYLEYLKSPEFNEVFDYYQKNTTWTLWADAQGFPAIISYSMRIVPQDSATQLKDKQVNLVFKLELSDINRPVKIDEPKDAKDLQEIIESNPYFKKGQDASIKANLSYLLTNGAVYYDKNKNYNNWCISEDYVSAKEKIDDTYGEGSKVACKCNTTNCALAKKWCVSALLNSGEYYCVDSSGIKTESESSNVCLAGVCD